MPAVPVSLDYAGPFCCTEAKETVHSERRSSHEEKEESV